MRLFGRNDTSLAAALIVGVFLLFHQPLQVVLDSAHDIERQYHIDLVQALVVLGAVLAFHQYRKHQDARAELAAAATAAAQAELRARELERLVGLSRALAIAADFKTLHHAFHVYLPKFTQARPCWLLMCQEGCWDVLVRGAGDQRAPDELEAIAARALASSAGASSTSVGDLMCFPLMVGGHAVGVLLVQDVPPLAEPDSRGLEGATAVGAVAIRNVQALLEARENSLRDRLTGCFNRGHAVDTLTSELRRARRSRSPLSILMFDVDHFKQVNDSYGHLAGDHVLAEIGRQLGEVLRLSDVKCRYGGDEFLIILPETPTEGARHLAESLRHEMARLDLGLDGGALRVTLSIGVVTAGHDEDARAVIARADAALYRAKHAGRNCLRVDESGPLRELVTADGNHGPDPVRQSAPQAAAMTAREPSVEEDESTMPRRSESHDALTTPPRILVVDDEDSVRALAERVLREAHYEVVAAAGGPEALQLAEPSSFDLCVLDLMMPDMTGDELGRQLRVRAPDVKVLYFTGYADRLFQTNPILGANEAFLEKPMSVTGLREAVSLLLFGHTQGPAAVGLQALGHVNEA